MLILHFAAAACLLSWPLFFSLTQALEAGGKKLGLELPVPRVCLSGSQKWQQSMQHDMEASSLPCPAAIMPVPQISPISISKPWLGLPGGHSGSLLLTLGISLSLPFLHT